MCPFLRNGKWLFHCIIQYFMKYGIEVSWGMESKNSTLDLNLNGRRKDSTTDHYVSLFKGQ